MLRDVLRGKHDEIIKSSEVADLEKAYTFALYSLIQISCDSREKMAEVLGQFLVHYDIPELHIYEHTGGVNWEGIKAAPSLMKLCRTAIEKCNLGPLIRRSYMEASLERKRSGKKRNKRALSNLGCVMPEDDYEAQPPSDSVQSDSGVRDSVNP